LIAVGYKTVRGTWSNIDESEGDDRSLYYLYENLVKLSILLLLLGIVLFIGGLLYIL
jgi:hypothetical protein